MASVLIRDTQKRDAERGEGHVNMKAEIGAMCLPIKGVQRVPQNHQKLGKRLGTDSLSWTSEETNTDNTLNCQDNIFLLFKSLNL